MTLRISKEAADWPYDRNDYGETMAEWVASSESDRWAPVATRTLEKIDRDRFRWFTLRDYLDTVWAWVINKP